MKNYKNLYFNGLGLVSTRKGKSTKYWGVSKVQKSKRYIIRVFNELVGQPQSVSGQWSTLAKAAEISALMYYLLTRGMLKRANNVVLYEANDKTYYLFEFRSAGNWIISKPINPVMINDYQASVSEQVTADQVHKDLMESIHFEKESEEIQLQEKLFEQEVEEEQGDSSVVIEKELPEDNNVFEEETVIETLPETESEYLQFEKEAARAMYKALVENGVEASPSFKKFVEVVHKTINS